jgi:hypothetical protein
VPGGSNWSGSTSLRLLHFGHCSVIQQPHVPGAPARPHLTQVQAASIIASMGERAISPDRSPLGPRRNVDCGSVHEGRIKLQNTFSFYYWFCRYTGLSFGRQEVGRLARFAPDRAVAFGRVLFHGLAA